MKNFIEIIKSRGFLHQANNEEGIQSLLETGQQTAYIGFDCTAKSLHVGSLLQIMMLRWWQKCGNTAIVLLGGITTKIGDPSGKDESRPALTDEQIKINKIFLSNVFEKVLDKEKLIIIDNRQWSADLNHVEFLTTIGKHFTVSKMLSMDSVKNRLDREQSLTFLEMNYMILQAYDFIKLNQQHKCRIQMGGSDQWGNITQGIDLGHKLGLHNLYGITSPLITTGGNKMGKTAIGAVWINADMLSPYDYWQFWRSVDDADVKRFLRLFTELDLEEIDELTEKKGQLMNNAKIRLANEATAILHGECAANNAFKLAEDVFSKGIANKDLPTFEITKSLPLNELLVQVGFAKSKTEGLKLIKGEGIYVDGKVIIENIRIDYEQIAKDIKVSKGKKKHILIQRG